MKIHQTPLEGAYILELTKFTDKRGYFFESYNHQKFCQLTGYSGQFIQDNQAFSHKNVVRGLHFQLAPHAQSKLVRVVSGQILDVIVDVRKDSQTFGQWFSVELSEENNRQLFVPKGFAHGYSVLSESGCVIAYKCDDYYHPETESGIHPLDETLNIDWKISPDEMIISDKDLLWKPLSETTLL